MEAKEMVVEVESLMEELTKVDLDLAYSSEKLVNLNGLLMQILAHENDREAVATSPESMEKALVFNLLSGVLDSELRELDSFMVSLEVGIVDVCRDASSCRDLTESYAMLEDKLQDSEESLKQTRYQISELKTQSEKLQRTALAFAQGKGEIGEVSLECGPLSSLNGQSNAQIDGQRNILHMLEKSLARELDLEKKLSESRKSEEELKIKLHYTEQVAFHMEETGQVVWGRFLEAENSAVVLNGISHDLLSRFQQFQFKFNIMAQRENELRSKYERCNEELKLKDVALESLNFGGMRNISDEAELTVLREKVKLLEGKVKETEFRLRTANAINDSSETRLDELENLVDSLRESVDMADTRAESSELKVAELTGTNVELNDELSFLKGSVGNTEKKLGLLEKQLREAEIQLQHAKVSSEAGQEQQNMLYSAIWDMETLIEDLKSKVAKAESKNESTEENCIMLSETNSELTKEVSVLRDRIEDLEVCLEQAKRSRLDSASEVDTRTKLMMEMVVKLASERERIQKQLNSLTKENKTFAEKLGFRVKGSSDVNTNTSTNEENDEDREVTRFTSNLSNSSCAAQSSMEAAKDTVGKSFQLDERSEEESTLNDDEIACVNTGNGLVSKLEDSRAVSDKYEKLKYVCVAIFVSLLSVLVMYFINQKQFLFV